MFMNCKNYFVDEAGDGTVFSRKGSIQIGKEGCSRFFILGLLDIENYEELDNNLDNLRSNLLTDPYFKNIPSMQPDQKKTAVAFHAKDDIPEVRREVFSLLKKSSGLRFFAVIKDKWSVLNYIRNQNHRDKNYRYNQNELYDYLVRLLFRDRLHKEDEYNIYFAKRGNADRTESLKTALSGAKLNFFKKWNIESNSLTQVIASTPEKSGGLQATDYFLWALQRLYERKEDRYIEYLWDSFRLVQDLDDIRIKEYGVYYTQKNPLTRNIVIERL